MDLFSSQTRLGIQPLIYCATCVFLYRYKFYFFEDRLSTLPLMTFCFVCLFTMIQGIIFYIFGEHIVLSGEWIKTHFFLVPLQNLFFAIAAFSIPSHLLLLLKNRFSFFRLGKRKRI